MATSAPLRLDRESILAFRRWVAALDVRLAAGERSREVAALAGLQDSMPRAALLSLAARVEEVGPSAWEERPMVQVWGPRFSAYVVAERDRGIFTIGRHPENGAARRRAETLAARLREHPGDQARPYDEVGRALGVNPNALRYATTTGTVLIRWEGARRPLVRSVPAPDLDPWEARLELARRYLHVFAPGTVEGFGKWAGLRTPGARAAFDALGPSLIPVRTPVGEGWILATDEPELRRRGARPGGPAPARLLPSGDTLFLLQGADRALLVPDATRRGELWTPRVWPGAVLLAGEVRGIWRRVQQLVAVSMWGAVSAAEWEAIEAEAAALPLPGLGGTPIRVRWEG